MEKTQFTEWREAAAWALKIVLIHRLFLLVWMAFIWVAIGAQLDISVGLHVDPIAGLPTLTPFEQATLGVWRRWDASHYLNLAQNGYRSEDPGPTVFGVLTPTGIRLFDILLPGGVDIGGMAFATLAFWLVLVMIQRICAVYYGDANLGRWATIILALLPHSFFFGAPMSDAIYLAMIIGFFYAAAKHQWLLAVIFGSLATLARHQGILIAGILALLILQDSFNRYTAWRLRIGYVIRHTWPIIIMAAVFGGYVLFREVLGLPSLGDTYITYSFSYIANPISGIIANIQWIVENPLNSLFNPDLWALISSLILTCLLWRSHLNGRKVFVLYILLYSLLFISRVNYVWGGYEQTTNTQSFARYSLALFPLTILIADQLRGASKRVRGLIIGLSVCGMLIFSALFTLGGGAP